MDVRALALTLVALTALFGSFVFGFTYPTPNFFSEIAFPLLAINFFLFGAIFFGYFAFIPHIIFGLSLGTQKNAAIFLYLIPLIVATYAGTKLGSSIDKDFAKKKYLINDLKAIVAMLIVAIILALVAEMALPYIIQYWPQDLMGLNIKETQDIWGMISSIKTARG